MLKFKTDELEQEFQRIDNRLKVLLYSIAGFISYKFGKDFIITCLFRDTPGSVHKYWRGADGATGNLTKDEGDEIVKFINPTCIYGKGDKLTIFDERQRTSPGWTGPHFHVQVNPLVMSYLSR